MTPSSPALERIRHLLSEPLAAAHRRECDTLPSLLAKTDGSVVIFGAGKLGRLCQAALNTAGIPVRAFCDNSSILYRKTIDGIPVLAPREAIFMAGQQSLFVVAIWSGTGTDSMEERLEFLFKNGCRHVTSFPVVLWACARKALPFYSLDLPTAILNQRDALLALADDLEDEVSRRVLAVTLSRGLQGHFHTAELTSPQYFPTGLFRPIPDEVFVDGGAYTGDTLAEFFKYSSSNFERYIGFEPDERNLKELQKFVRSSGPLHAGRIIVRSDALYSCKATLRFTMEGTTTSSIGVGSGVEIHAVALDEVPEANNLTFLKLDIEGAEQEAIMGAQNLLAENQPLVASCVYHRASDLWTLPKELRSHLPHHALFLREHGRDGWEMVCYAVPRERLLPAS